MFEAAGRLKWWFLGIFLVAMVVAGWQRAVAVRSLPPDFDEMVYLPAAFEYRRLAGEGDWAGVVNYRENLEHPPMVKLMFAAELAATSAPNPDWSRVEVGKPVPPEAQPAFFGTRWLSWTFGMGQLALVGLVHPVAALLLSVSTYHAKYSAQAYLESVPALFAIVAVLLFERAFRKRDAGPHRALFFASAVLLGLATAGKYPYGLVTGLGIAPFLPLWLKGRVGWWFGYVGVALLAFFVADPFLWPEPLSRLLESIGFHYGFSQSEHVKRSGLPWHQPLYWLTHSEPSKWHKGLFFTSISDWVMLPLAVLGLWRALRTRPVFASWFLIGLAFLFVWPTKWPQYILLILPAVAVCAALGIEEGVLRVKRLWPTRAAAAQAP